MRTWSGRAFLAAAALATGAAAPPHGTLIAFTLPAASSATSPAPAPDVPGFTPAPVPNIDLQFGGDRKTESSEPSLSATVFHQGPTYFGEGYTPNSTLPGTDAAPKKLLPSAGVNLSVPLE